MATNTNQPDETQPLCGPLDSAPNKIDAAQNRSPFSARDRSRRPGFWEKQVDPPGNQDSLQINIGVLPAPEENHDAPDLGKSIEAVLSSKARPRKRRHSEPRRNVRYPDETSRPIVSLAFVLPFLVFYEIGSILLGGESLRSGIDQWIHQVLSRFGFGELVVLPIVTIAVMIVWHHRNHDHWTIRPKVLVGMLLEAIGLGLILFWAANAISLFVAGPSTADVISSTVGSNQWWAIMVTCVGSGIYEELIFRIIVLVPLIFWARKLFSNTRLATVIGVIAVSLLLAAVHYNVFNPAGNEFELSSFVFRFFASIVFCLLFLFRGFGIAVGAHVAYDVLTQV